MKTRKFSKKLTLNRKTIVHLDNGVMGKVYGGQESFHISICPTCPDTILLTNCQYSRCYKCIATWYYTRSSRRAYNRESGYYIACKRFFLNFLSSVLQCSIFLFLFQEIILMSQSKFLCPFGLRSPTASVLSVSSVAKNNLPRYGFLRKIRNILRKNRKEFRFFRLMFRGFPAFPFWW